MLELRRIGLLAAASAVALVGAASAHAQVAAPSAVAASAPARSRAPSSGGGQWNRLDLLDQLAPIGGPESRYDALASARAFGLLQRALEEMRQLVLHDAASEQEAAEGLRMLLKVLAMATTDVLQGDPRHPLFRRLDTRFRDVGAYNPDAEYEQAWIDGRYDHRLEGNLGGARYVSMTVNGRAENASSRLVAYLDDASIREHADASGNFTLWLTKQKPKQHGAWIPLPDDADSVVIRQYLADRAREPLATFSIQAIGDALPPAGPLSDEQIAGRIARIATFLVVNSSWHRTLMPQALASPNRFFDRSGAALGGNVANAESLYQMAHYQIAKDEALVIDFVPPKTRFWNLTSASIWHESERFLTEPVSLTLDEVETREDGSVRFVLAHRDPGLPNWLDTFEHTRGFLIFRMVGVASNPLPSVQRVKWSELSSVAAADAAGAARASRAPSP